MKKNFIAKYGIFLLLVTTLAACDGLKSKTIASQENNISQEYTCPMHPQIIQDKPGTCPICGMDLVLRHVPGTETTIDSGLAHLLKPVNQQVVSTISSIRPENTSKILTSKVQGTITYDTRSQVSVSSRVGGRIERLLIKYNYQPVRKGQLIMEIYSPDLAAAQRELLMISQTDKGSGMLQRAKQRLSLLGMQNEQINSILKSGKIFYRIPVYSNATGYILEKSVSENPLNSIGAGSLLSSSAGDEMGMGGQTSSPSAGTSGATSPVLLREGQYVQAGQMLFTIYNQNNLIADFALPPSLAARIKKGQKLLFYRSAEPATIYTGSIGLIQPTLSAGSDFVTGRVYLKDKSLEIGQLVTADISILSCGWWLPQKTVLSLGDKSVVFKKEEEIFIPVEIKTIMMAEGWVLIDGDIGNWEVASNAAFLVDSESFIKVVSENQLKNKK